MGRMRNIQRPGGAAAGREAPLKSGGGLPPPDFLFGWPGGPMAPGPPNAAAPPGRWMFTCAGQGQRADPALPGVKLAHQPIDQPAGEELLPPPKGRKKPGPTLDGAGRTKRCQKGAQQRFRPQGKARAHGLRARAAKTARRGLLPQGVRSHCYAPTNLRAAPKGLARCGR